MVPGLLGLPPHGHMYGTLHTHFPKIFFKSFSQQLWFVLIGVGYVTNYEPDRMGISGYRSCRRLHPSHTDLCKEFV